MGEDSNPRWTFAHCGFQDRRLRPLGHPSGTVFYRVFLAIAFLLIASCTTSAQPRRPTGSQPEGARALPDSLAGGSTPCLASLLENPVLASRLTSRCFQCAVDRAGIVTNAVPHSPRHSDLSARDEQAGLGGDEPGRCLGPVRGWPLENSKLTSRQGRAPRATSVPLIARMAKPGHGCRKDIRAPALPSVRNKSWKNQNASQVAVFKGPVRGLRSGVNGRKHLTRRSAFPGRQRRPGKAVLRMELGRLSPAGRLPTSCGRCAAPAWHG